MNIDTYLQERVQDQLHWFERKSAWNQKRYRILKTTILVLSGSIPFMAGMVLDMPFFQWGIAIAGLLIAIAEGLISINKYHDNWVQYRASAEALKREQFLLSTGTGPYRDLDTADRLEALVSRVEDILGSDNEQWRRYVGEEKK